MKLSDLLNPKIYKALHKTVSEKASKSLVSDVSPEQLSALEQHPIHRPELYLSSK